MPAILSISQKNRQVQTTVAQLGALVMLIPVQSSSPAFETEGSWLEVHAKDNPKGALDLLMTGALRSTAVNDNSEHLGICRRNAAECTSVLAKRMGNRRHYL